MAQTFSFLSFFFKIKGKISKVRIFEVECNVAILLNYSLMDIPCIYLLYVLSNIYCNTM